MSDASIQESIKQTSQGNLSVRCTARYLCDKYEKEFCHLVSGEFRSCMYFDEKNVMYASPDEIKCREAYNCKYAGKRPNQCSIQNGHVECGTTINGNAPEGNLPDDSLKRLRQVIPFCNIGK